MAPSGHLLDIRRPHNPSSVFNPPSRAIMDEIDNAAHSPFCRWRSDDAASLISACLSPWSLGRYSFSSFTFCKLHLARHAVVRMVVEQIEVIEHRIIEEGRRPSGGALLPPITTVRETRETFEQRGDQILDHRYEATGERDVSREASFLHNSANYGQHLEVSPQRYNVSAAHNASLLNTSGNRLDQSTSSPNRTVINNFGYDVHEIHTTEGGARIVETHGGGPLREMSRTETSQVEEIVHRPTVASAVRNGLRGSSQQVFTVPSPAGGSWRQYPSDSESLARKDSYRAMQTSWDGEERKDLSSRHFPPRSETSLMSEAREKVSWVKRLKNIYDGITYAIRNSESTSQQRMGLCCILLLLLLLIFLLFIIFRAIFNAYAVHEFLLFPPVCEECRRKNPNIISAALPSSVFVHFYSRSQAHFELRGNAPFKSNSFTAIDFSTGYVAFADHALTDTHGRHTVCFLMPLDRSAIENMDSLSEAVSDSSYEIQSTFGWQEFWQFDPEPIEPVAANSKFSDRIEDCTGAKWYLLRQNVHARDASCSDCYDFCLPDWAVVRKEKYDDDSTIGVRRLNCFRLYVPEWRNFRVETDFSGGHWQYPLASQSTKRDKHGNWVSWVPTGKLESKRQRREILQA
ncbi:unnamed protein product [Caenorhabditis auriculariae]|uniref:BRICHOS domain-containing protein n=1 Tax=Caenorhabditis auriculariae TaxID=2777116 RepID=A0A8S1GXN5_9PELO|nr:unnamed protein product [Caenorhabditis auriculariae]